MQLDLVLGPHGAGKARHAVQAMVDACAGGGTAFLVVPGSVDRSRFLRELAGREQPVVGAEVGAFAGLVERLAGTPAVQRTDAAMERVVVRDALQRVPELAPAARWSGFVETARRHVLELRRGTAWGPALREHARERLPGGDPAAWDELACVVEELLAERRLRDDAWFEQRAARELDAGRAHVDAVVAYGFETLPPARMQLLEHVALVLPVTVALPWRAGRRVHERVGELRDRWRGQGARILEEDGEVDALPLLRWAGDELFEDADPGTAPAPDGDAAPPPVARFVDCCGSVQEAEEVAREVARLLDEGLEPDEVAVASARIDGGAELLMATLRRAGIPASLQAARRAVDVPAGRALHALLAAIESDDPMELVAALRAPQLARERAVVDAAELRLRRAPRRERGTIAPGSPALRCAGPQVRALHAAHVAGQDVVGPVQELLTALLPRDRGDLELLAGAASLVESLAAAAGGREGIGIRDLVDAVERLPLEVPDRTDAGTVAVTTIADMRSVRVDALVLHGMHAGAFAAPAEDDADRPRAARDLLHLAVTRARRRLVVVRQQAGSDGGLLAPHPAWSELRRLLPADRVDVSSRSRGLGEVAVAPADVVLAAEAPTSVALARGEGIQVEGVDEATEEILRQARRVPREPRVADAALERIRARRHVAATEVETYATCSARWFITKRLRVRDPDDDRVRLVTGLLAHQALQDLAPLLHGDGGEELALGPRVRRSLAAARPEIDRDGVLDDVAVERIGDDVVTVLEAERAWPSPTVVEVETALDSRLEGARRGLVLEDHDEEGAVEVVGRVDRLDVHAGSSAVLHDYKYRSHQSGGARKLLANLELQLLVYWLALEQAAAGGGDDAPRPVGAVYRAIRSEGRAAGIVTEQLRELQVVTPRTRVADDEELRDVLESARTLVRDVVGRMRAGEVMPLESARECPPHCRLQPICRIGEATTT